VPSSLACACCFCARAQPHVSQAASLWCGAAVAVTRAPAGMRPAGSAQACAKPLPACSAAARATCCCGASGRMVWCVRLLCTSTPGCSRLELDTPGALRRLGWAMARRRPGVGPARGPRCRRRQLQQLPTVLIAAGADSGTAPVRSLPAPCAAGVGALLMLVSQALRAARSLLCVQVVTPNRLVTTACGTLIACAAFLALARQCLLLGQ